MQLMRNDSAFSKACNTACIVMCHFACHPCDPCHKVLVGAACSQLALSFFGNLNSTLISILCTFQTMANCNFKNRGNCESDAVAAI